MTFLLSFECKMIRALSILFIKLVPFEFQKFHRFTEHSVSDWVGLVVPVQQQLHAQYKESRIPLVKRKTLTVV